MEPKINVQHCLILTLAGFGGYLFIDKLEKAISPYVSWGSNMCKICNCYECSSYNHFCDYCADDVYEEFRNEDQNESV